MTKQLILPLLIIVALLTACSETDGVNGPVDMTTWDIATFEGNIDGAATFTVSPGDDAPTATLTAQSTLDSENILASDRVYITYIPADNRPYTDGPIRLLSVSSITQGDVKAGAFDPDGGWDADPVYLLTIWRTGSFINIYCRLPYYTEPRSFGLIADESTVDSERPQLYLEHRLPEAVNTFSRTYYASFDVTSLITSPTVTALDIHIRNSNLPTDLYSFPIRQRELEIRN